MTMVKGKVLYDHGKYTDGSYTDVFAEMQDLVAWVRSAR